MAKKKIQIEPKSKLGLNNKIHICYNCMFYGSNGWCPWENKLMNYNDKCTKQLRKWPHTYFRFKLNLPYKLIDPTKNEKRF